MNSAVSPDEAFLPVAVAARLPEEAGLDARAGFRLDALDLALALGRAVDLRAEVFLPRAGAGRWREGDFFVAALLRVDFFLAGMF
ncbi:MAG TPA: hypothetical protein VND22_00240 [Actinomycetota bacterium]|nr:hypothetical protein [Actinomycetota bacterium]